jgi:CP family cyanate transporter-like MFS transporter
MLATIPILCMGLFAFPASRVLRRTDIRTAIAGSLLVIAATTVPRALAPGFLLVLALTFPFGIASGVMGALLPAVVKGRFAERPAFATGVFTFGLNAGASLGAGLAVPLAHALGGWRWSLGTLAAVGAVAVPAWIVLSRDCLGDATRAPSADRLPWRSPLAWAVTLVFGFQALCFFGLNAWLADVMVERGWRDGQAGALVALLNIGAVPGVLLVALLAGRFIPVDRYLVLSAVGLLVATVALTAADGTAWGWIVLMSLSLGSLFALSMTLAVLIARSPSEAAAVAGMQLGVGYTMAAIAPLALGALRDETGDFESGMWVVSAIAALVLTAALGTVALLRRRVYL